MTIVASNYARRANDLYSTERFATEGLIRVFPQIFPDHQLIWECAAGRHHMADVISETGATVITSDIEEYDRRHDFLYDFLDHEPLGLIADAIVTNPPYGKGNRTAVRFCEKALERCDGYVAMLLTAKFDFGNTRLHLFRENPRFLGKIALVDRISWTGDGETGTEDHAWYVWGPESDTPHRPQLYWAGRAE